MSSTLENTILDLPRRPPMGDASAAAVLGALALGILTGGLGAALIGGVAGSALASQPQPLEMAIRDYLRQQGLEVIFYYPAPRSVKVTFQYEPNAYWTVESIIPDHLQLSTHDADDWLYGNLITVELPQVLRRIRRASRMSLDEAIVRLEKLIGEVRQASLIDDKTPLGSPLALRQQGRLINAGSSEFNVVVFGDLNDFKSLNDEFGHEAGDIAIRSVGETLHETIAKTQQGKAFRQSGDEFVILLKQESLHGFLSGVPSFAQIDFSHKQEKLSTAMSFGYALSDGKTSLEDLLERAELACLHAKGQADGSCIEWTESIKVNPLVRLGGKCQRCNARITCNVPKQHAPLQLKVCPCCGDPIEKVAKAR